MTNIERALELVPDGARIGLGTGRAASEFIRALGQRVQAGFHVTGVPTSQATADQARQLGIPLAALDEALPLDLAVDGADEVDPRLNLIKGLGGALVREKIVAAAARQYVILVGAEKLVTTLGERGVLPVEVVPFGSTFSQRSLSTLGLQPELRMTKDAVFVTDNGNYLFDCRTSPINDPEKLEREILAIPGVVGTGLFLNMADVILIQHSDQVEERRRS